MMPATAKEARAQGATRYFTGKPCRRGHVCERKADNGGCVECDKIAAKKFRESEYGKEFYRRHARSEKSMKRLAEYNKLPKQRTYQTFWKRSQEAGPAMPSWLTDEQKLEMRAFYEDAHDRDGDFHVDHIIPLNHALVCGLHVPWNLQVLTAADNMRKHRTFDGTMNNEGWR